MKKRIIEKEVIITTQRNPVTKQHAVHILITGKCNSNCIFCFSRKELKKEHVPRNVLKKIIRKYYLRGYRILVLSGGEPTIHPDFIDIVRYAKSIGYNHIKVISNGRMFSYNSFVESAISAGLNEVVISAHSHREKDQDRFSAISGGFKQVIAGIKNCLEEGLETRINIVVNNGNIKELKNTIKFFSCFGVKSISILRIMPFGKAWEDKRLLFPNNSRNLRYVQEALSFAKKMHISLGANRFDLSLFKEYPEFMQDPFKFVNEVEARINEFEDLTEKGKKLFCYPERCAYCFLEDFCKEIHRMYSPPNKIKSKGGKARKSSCLNALEFAEAYAKKFKK